MVLFNHVCFSNVDAKYVQCDVFYLSLNDLDLSVLGDGIVDSILSMKVL